ncbi:hypothetical protein J4407_00080 [Candidatus Pacearchaeota archaeon]|nr:hypothetical protein [Candidatus Pacearchaeota archaeon]
MFLLDLLTFIVLVFYAYCTYLIAKDIYEPFVSFYSSQVQNTSKLISNLINKSKVEVELCGKLWAKVNGQIFEFKEGKYGGEFPWIIQPFTNVQGNLDLKELKNSNQIKLENYVTKNKIDVVNFKFQIKYRKAGSNNKWKKSYPQKLIYKFRTNVFWMDV